MPRGGPRPNSGGARPGAGRPRKATILIAPEPVAAPEIRPDTPAAFLLSVVHDPAVDAKLRVDAAKALLPYYHAKVGEQSKAAAAETAAATAEQGTGWQGLLN